MEFVIVLWEKEVLKMASFINMQALVTVKSNILARGKRRCLLGQAAQAAMFTMRQHFIFFIIMNLGFFHKD